MIGFRHIKIIIPVFVFLLPISGYILQIEKINEPRVIMVGPGYGLEINNGRALTALHVAEKLCFPIVYEDVEKDLAIIETNHANKYKLRFISHGDDFLFIDTVPKPGESGMPYVTDNEVNGVIIGESRGRGVVSALDEIIISVLTQ